MATTNKSNLANQNAGISGVANPSTDTITAIGDATTLGGIPSDSRTTGRHDYNVNPGLQSVSTGHSYDIINAANFPINRGTPSRPSYDYTTDVTGLNLRTSGGGSTTGDAYLKEIKENLNIYSAYSKFEINNKYHTEFNRFRLDHPDIFLRNTIAYIVFTRPDLNLFEDSGNLRDELEYDPRVNYISRHNPHVAKSLTHTFDGSVGHNFHPFLSNLAQGIDIQDDMLDTMDTGETFTGYKFQYAKHNIKSITAGNISVKFKETFDLGITNTFQLWVDYISGVYRGSLTPKEEYIWYKNIDYMCNVYYFLLDQDGETVLFWSKYFGVFPQNVPKSTFSWDMGSQVQLPELNVSFGYIYREDLSPLTLVEFNNDAGLGAATSVSYVPAYNEELGHSGRTWTGVPFISSVNSSNGINTDNYGFKMRFRSTSDAGSFTRLADSQLKTTYNSVATSSTSEELSDRELVRRACGFEDNTMRYLDSWTWGPEIYRKCAAAIRSKAAAGMSGSNYDIVKACTGLMDHTLQYVKDWTWGEEALRKLAVSMKKGYNT